MHSSRLVVVVVVLGLVGCSGQSSSAGSSDSAALLTAARTTLAATDTVHFTLTSSDVPAGGTRLVSGEGVIARPKQFQGTLAITLNGSQISVDLISTGGKVYAKLPFSSGFQVANPADFGLSDPATLIDANTGIARMFGELTGVTDQGSQRIGDDVVTELDGALPGSVVGDLLTSADPAQPVQTELYVTKSGHQLRRVVLTGPFFVKGKNSTFNLLLDKYGEPVTITAPPSS
jgi:hypothetical protein